MNNPSINFIQNSLYSYIQEYEFLIPIFGAAATGALTGAQIGRTRGAALGGIIGIAAGITDKLLIHYDIASKHYFTSALLGISVMNPFQLPYYIGEMSGAIMGFVAPTGYLNNLSGIVPTIMTTAVTTQYAREKFPQISHNALYGATAGAIISLTDETMIYLNVSEKHYLSTTTIISVSFDFMAPKFNNIISWATSFTEKTHNLHNRATEFANNIPHFSLMVGTIFGAYASNKTDLNILNWKPILLGNDLLKTYKNLINKKELEQKIESFAIITTSTQLLSYYAIFKESESFQIISPLYADLGDNTRAARTWNPIKMELLKYFFLIMPTMTISYFTSSFLNNYLSTQISYSMEDSTNLLWLTNNTALKLSKHESTLALIHHKTDDIQKIAKDGSSLIGKAFSYIIGGFISVGFMTNHKAIEVIIYSLLYNKITSQISNTISNQINKYSDTIRNLVAEQDNLEKDITNKIEIITERGGVQYHHIKLNNVTHTLRNFSEQKKSWETIHYSWLRLKHFSNFVFNYLTTAFKLYDGSLEFNVRYKILDSVTKFFSLISFEIDNKARIQEIENALENINKLIDGIKNSSEITKKHNTEYQKDALSITFKNFIVYIEKENQELVHIEYMHLPTGIYAIGGAKGSGKSSFTSQIIDLDNGISTNGTIIFSTPDGIPPKIISIPQTNHLPLCSTLLELFYYPQLLPTDPEQIEALSIKVKELWSKIVIENNSTISLMKKLNAREDWAKILSGGEQKIVFLISAILQEPDILILDETFNGLDQHTNQKARNVLKDYFADENIILCIDHYALDNNFKFYNKCLNLTNHEFDVIDL